MFAWWFNCGFGLVGSCWLGARVLVGFVLLFGFRAVCVFVLFVTLAS